MPHDVSKPIQRWVNEPERAGIDAELGELFRALPEESPLEAAALGAVGRRLAKGGASRRPRHVRQLLLAAAVLFTATGVALAQWGKPLLEAISPSVAPPHAAPAPAPAPRRAAAKPAPIALPPSTDALPPPPTPPSVAAPVAPAPVAAPNDAARVAQPAAVANLEPESALSRESALLSRALTALRRDHDASAALRLLDDYQTQFPRGVMALEAATARVDALLLLGRRAPALQLLSSLPLERSGRRTELTLLRAELNAERDCSRALPDFDAVLASSPAGALAERALFGRAGCQLRLGRAAEGKADLQSYAARFPHGRFAEQVRARLAE